MPNFTGHFGVPSVAKGLAIVRGFGRDFFSKLAGSGSGGSGGASLDTEITDFRVEAYATGSVILRWNYSGTASVKLYRSTDGLTYTLVDTIALGTLTYSNTGLDDKTKYWYKLTDDLGITFSVVVTVVTYAVNTPRNIANATVMTGRRAKEAYASQKDFNELVLALEQEENVKSVESTPCNLCLNDGALIIDCSTGCEWFQVVMDEDINSITLLGCDDCPQVDFIIPPNTTRRICGWPVGCDYFGDECFEAPIDGGPDGRTAKTNGTTYGGYGGGGGGSGPQSPDCPCPPSTVLSIKCCEEDNTCILSCSDDTSVRLKACGGLNPYRWSVASGIVSVTDFANTTATKDVGNTLAQLSKTEGVSNIASVSAASCVGRRVVVGVKLTTVTSNCANPADGIRHDHFIKQANIEYDCGGGIVNSNVDLGTNIKFSATTVDLLSCLIAGGCTIGSTTVPWVSGSGPGTTDVCGGTTGTVTVTLADNNLPDIGLAHVFTYEIGEATFTEATTTESSNTCP